MHGVSGSGKSWLSEQLVPALPAIRIRSDLERKRLAGIAAHQSAAAAVRAGIYSPQFSHRTYATLYDDAEAALRSGFNVIVDAAFLDAADRELFRGLAQRLGVQVVILACNATAQELANRIKARARAGDTISDADTHVLTEQLRQLQPFATNEQSQVITVNTQDSNGLDLVMASLQQRLGTAMSRP
jgi:predicted kinase